MHPLVQCGMKLVSHKNLQIIHKLDKKKFFLHTKNFVVQFLQFVHYFVGEVKGSLSVQSRRANNCTTTPTCLSLLNFLSLLSHQGFSRSFKIIYAKSRTDCPTESAGLCGGESWFQWLHRCYEGQNTCTVIQVHSSSGRLRMEV